MRIANVEIPTRGRYLCRVEADTAIPLMVIASEAGRDPLREGLTLPDKNPIDAPAALSECRLLAPVLAPQKILAIGRNYAEHAKETGSAPPTSPVTFVKTNNSIIGPGDPIRYRTSDSNQVDYEAELAVVIGRVARDVKVNDALSYVLGYTCCNDVTARDAQYGGGQWVRGKSFDTFCPLGPWIVTADEIPDPQALGIRCRVNGETLQDSTTAEMIFGVSELISYLSRFLTLEPGDVISTGTPSGIGFARQPQRFLLDGDVVEVELEGIGVLRNPVIAAP